MADKRSLKDILKFLQELYFSHPDIVAFMIRGGGQKVTVVHRGSLTAEAKDGIKKMVSRSKFAFETEFLSIEEIKK